MSVFAAPAMPLPPRYSSTRPQPPPYRTALSKPLSSNPPSIPPPIYKATTNTTTSSRSSSPAPSISTIAEPPQYAPIISAPRPKPQPTATTTRVRDLPTWKDPYVETDAADSIYQLERRNERRRAEEEEEEESSNWCLGCFWVGPSMQQPWVTHVFI